MSSYWYLWLFLNTTEFILFFPFSLFVTSFSDIEKPGFHFYNEILHFYNVFISTYILHFYNVFICSTQVYT